MKKFISSVFFFVLLGMNASNANPGDTIAVQTFTFGSPQDAWFVFPSDTMHFEKILMQYTLKCNPAQSPACGEWDYLTYTYLWKNTGLQDSTLIHQPVFTVNGTSPDSVQYMNTPSYSYQPSWQYNTVHIDTTSLSTYSLGAGSSPDNFPLGASAPVSRCQYLWKASEMSAAGMAAGNITGLQFYLQSLGGQLRNLNIRIQSSTLDSLNSSNMPLTGFTDVYSHTTTFSTTGWNSLQLTTPFNWDGTSNLIIEITYDNLAAGINNVVEASTTSFNSGMTNAGSDRTASFHTYGYIDVPLNNDLVALDSFVTVTYWAYGTPAFQPQDGTCFEAIDSAGNRILNAHMPWSDSNVYWDAGYGGTSYDRINKVATTSEIEGKWNHWAFTKNIVTGTMKIYLNGVVWHNAIGKTKRMTDIKAFRIGKGNWSGSQTYEGQLDEFSVFNAELSQATIQAYMKKPVDPSHPNYSNLALYYHFDDGNYMTAADAAPVSHPVAALNSVDNPLKSPADLVYNFSQTSLRPNITFEQGVFNSYLDSVQVIDSTINAPVQIITYNDSISNPGVATDTLTVWPAYYNNYVYDAAGNAIDSTFVTPDSILQQVYYDWYQKFPQVLRFELARYITPYGNGLNLGAGWTWTFDVSDYRTLLADSVHLSAGNWQELLSMKFLMIEGTPPRDVVGIQNLWNGGFNFGQPADPIESHLPAKNISIPATALTTRWKSRITGHGMDTPENCAEFCAKSHYFKVNGVQKYSKLVWRNNCDVNPLYPQGGTWVYDRANWCPGAEVWTYDMELTPFVTPGTVVSLDHDVQPYVNTGGWDYYQIEDQLVSYGAPNFTLDAAVEDILSPSKDQMWSRYNPVCTTPVIRIKNTGSTPLTSLTITYGMNGATPSVYNWTGNLPFMEIEEVTLGQMNWALGASNFTVTISNPNGGADQYANNNSKTTKYTYPPVMPTKLVIEFKTNNYNWEDSYTLTNDAGAIVHSRDGNLMAPNTLARDTLDLPTGCYTLEVTDLGEDGLNFWANSAQGNGYFRFKSGFTGAVLKSWGTDFGGKIYYQFTVGLTSDVADYIFTDHSILNVYPNPSDGHVFIDMSFAEKKDGTVEIFDVLGKSIYHHQFENLTAESLEADLSEMKPGMYFVTLKTGNEVLSKKVTIR
jgi:hypothetical protein